MSRVRKIREIERPGRLKLLLRRQRRNLRLVALFAVGSGLVFAAVAGARSAQNGGTVAKLAASFGRATDLRVERITFSTHTNTPEARLIEALAVKEGDPILGFSVDAARARLETLPWIAHVSVERRLPAEIHVELTEGRPFAIWQNQNNFVLVDRDGATVADEDVTRFGELPLIVGNGAPAQAGHIVDLLRNYPQLHDRIDAYVRVGERRWNLLLRNKTLIMLPEGHESEALARLTQIDAQQQLLTRPLAVIDMRLADKMYIRPRAPETASLDAGAATNADGNAAPAATNTPAKPHQDSKPAAAHGKQHPSASAPTGSPAGGTAGSPQAARIAARPATAKIAPAHSLQPHSGDSVPRDIIAQRRAT